MAQGLKAITLNQFLRQDSVLLLQLVLGPTMRIFHPQGISLSRDMGIPPTKGAIMSPIMQQGLVMGAEMMRILLMTTTSSAEYLEAGTWVCCFRSRESEPSRDVTCQWSQEDLYHRPCASPVCTTTAAKGKKLTDIAVGKRNYLLNLPSLESSTEDRHARVSLSISRWHPGGNQ